MQLDLYADAPQKRKHRRASKPRAPAKRTSKPVLPANWRHSHTDARRSDAAGRFIASLLRPAAGFLVTRLEPIGKAARMFPIDCLSSLLLAGRRGDGVVFHDGERWTTDFEPVAVPIAGSGPRELLAMAIAAERMELHS